MSMTLDELRDWHAMRAKWELIDGETNTDDEYYPEHWRRDCPERGEYEYRDTHPFPPTLDGSELAKTPGWWLSVHHRPKHGGGETWYGDAMNTHPDGGTGYKSVTETAGNEIELRYLLWMKAWEQEAAR